ncbi:hypothetical protein EPT55_08440 [Fusobacterium necrophorum]|uniref:hypothetical protein n=1 Tax=Fusobacterium necrophorum TaxID=859 RepID=UPI0010108664|nr:hypothetical protein [Fusobacterium necrophorum]RXZ26591.1 hypothetical protein EPT55_08440 [Fusobacterium necrophorum]
MNDIFQDLENALEVKKFDFCALGISQEDQEIVEENEKIFMNTFRKYRNNLFGLCESLYNISEALKKTDSFMAWYESIGLSKDMVSVLLKRWQLYTSFPDYQEKVFSLSDLAIKTLTHKDVLYDDQLAILQGNVTIAKDIKELLAPAMEKNEMDFKKTGEKYFNFKKIKKMENRMNSLKDKEFKEFQTELREYITKLQELLEYKRYDMSKSDDENQYTIKGI